jgi:surface protein
MFFNSNFNGDISQWNVSNVTNMYRMFEGSKFNGDISEWDVKNVKNMHYIFLEYDNQDLSNWKPYSLEVNEFLDDELFAQDNMNTPYWAKYSDIESRRRAIDSYWCEKELEQELNINLRPQKRIKI